MDNLVKGIPYTATYLDDILVTGRTDDEHVANLDTVLQRIYDSGLRLRADKCQFMVPEVSYLGFKVDKNGLHPLPDKIIPILELPEPTNMAELQSFLGMATYYSRFLPNLASTLAPLYDLLKKNSPWQWGKRQQASYKQAKELLASPKFLIHYSLDLPLVLSVDASPYGLGAVISHRVQGVDRPIAFASRTLTCAEKNNAQLDKEALAVVFGVTKFKRYVFGREFTITTDHKPLLGLLGEGKPIPETASARMQRWALTLQGYRYKLIFVPGKENVNADALSRLPLPLPTTQHVVTPAPPETVHLMEHLADSPVTPKMIRTWTERDPLLSRIRAYTQYGWPETCEDGDSKPYFLRRRELSLQDGCLLWGSRVIVPPQGRQRILEELHSTYTGIYHTKSFARSFVWWPKLDEEIEQTARDCSTCQQSQNCPVQVPMHPWQWSSKPWDRVHVDHFGPFRGHIFLILVDSYSKWVEVAPVSSTSSVATIAKLRTWFATHGLPATLVSDNGTGFVSEEFEGFLKKNGIHHITSPAYHPASNGLAERGVRIIKEALKKQSSGDIQCKLDRILFKYRITPHTTTHQTPAELLMGRRPRSHLDHLRPRLHARVEEKQLAQKEYHDTHTKERTFSIGEPVYVYQKGSSSEWVPGTVSGIEGQVVLADCSYGKLRRHLNHVRPRYDVHVAPPPPPPYVSEGQAEKFNGEEPRPVTPPGTPQPQAPETQELSPSLDNGVKASPAAPLRRSTRVPKPTRRLDW